MQQPADLAMRGQMLGNDDRDRRLAPLRVLHVAPSIHASLGGSTAATLGLCRALVKLGIYVDLVTTNSAEIGGLAQMRSPAKLAVPINSPVLWQGLNCRFFDAAWPPRLGIGKGMRSWLDTNVRNYDVVHVHSL